MQLDAVTAQALRNATVHSSGATLHAVLVDGEGECLSRIVHTDEATAKRGAIAVARAMTKEGAA